MFPFFLFLLAFIPRVTALVGSATLWHARGRDFIDAFLSGQLAQTYLAPHPGVTTMWLVGLVRWLGLQFNPDYDGTSVSQRLNLEIIPIALVVSLAIVLAFFLLKRIFGFQIAAFSTLLLALDPYHISLSKVIHVDALLSTFMLLAALLLWVFLQDGRRFWVFLSGICAGLALLTKTTAVFLVPYFFLCMLVWQEAVWRRKRSIGAEYEWPLGLRKVAMMSFVWFLPLALIYFILWPALWVRPVETLALTYGGANFYRKTPHENPILFFGRVTAVDPGPFFYPVNLVIKTTAVTLTGFLLSFYVLIRSKMRNYQRQAIFLAMAFIFFFLLMMSLGEKKLSRYVMPASQFVIILAGFGWVYTLRKLWHGHKSILQLSLIFLIGIQLIINITRFPYYGTHYNYLLGGPRRILQNEVVAGQEFGIGVELAAEYLNDFPLSTELVVGAQNWLDFYHYFQGKTVPLTDDKVDYLLFTRNWTVRGIFAHEWGSVWEAYREREPKHVISFDGVPFIWIYKVGPLIDEESMTNKVNAVFGQDVRLLGYDFSPQEALPGETVLLTLYWEASSAELEDYTVFTHLVDQADQLRGQRDNQPQKGMYPTYLWDQGERIQDQYEIQIDLDAPPGDYNFRVGMYELQTLERLPVMDNQGEELVDRALVLPGPVVVSDD